MLQWPELDRVWIPRFRLLAMYLPSLTVPPVGILACKHNSKNGPVIVSYKQRSKLTVVYSLLIHDCTTFNSRDNIINENTVITEGIQITLYLIMSSISLVRHNMNAIRF